MSSLTPADVKARRAALHLTQGSLAELLGVDANTVARWEQGKVACPEPAARLLRLLVELCGGSERQAQRTLEELRGRVTDAKTA